ncbi:MAG: Csp1 family four helix bundle copper storage protein [Polyangiales bacterium]|nr:Csp1 family four helix bundle copper storage protein [Sandaracinaceae bacterium]
MNRREMLKVGAATAVAHGVVTVLGCAAQAGEQGHEGHSGGESAAPSDARQAFARAAGECVTAGEACLSHCLRSLQAGDTSMAECSRKVHAMLAICRAVPALATSGSGHLGRLAALCRDVCQECHDACAPHAAHHAECRACMEACAATLRHAAAFAA